MATDKFLWRHVGPRPEEIDEMLKVTGVGSMEELIEQTVPKSIRLKKLPDLPAPLTESEFFDKIRGIAAKNKIYRSFIGQGYYDTISPAVITRNILAVRCSVIFRIKKYNINTNLRMFYLQLPGICSAGATRYIQMSP